MSLVFFVFFHNADWYSCHHALGMASGDITDDMVTASSESNSNFGAEKARPGNGSEYLLSLIGPRRQ